MKLNAGHRIIDDMLEKKYWLFFFTTFSFNFAVPSDKLHASPLSITA